MDSDDKVILVFVLLAMGWIPVFFVGYWVYEIINLFL